MFFFHLFSILAILLRPVVANSERFRLLVIRSGSPLQYAGVYATDDHLYLGHSNYSLSAMVTDCGFLLFDDGSYAAVANSGGIKKSTFEDATNTFAVKNGHLTFFNVAGFEAVPRGNKFLLSTKSTSDSWGIIIRAQSLKKGYPVADFVAANNCSTKIQIPSDLNTVVENSSLNESENTHETYLEIEDVAIELKNHWNFYVLLTLLAAIML